MGMMSSIRLAALLALAPVVVLAATLEVDRAWCRATPPGVSVGAAYLTLDNRARRGDRLLKISSPRASKVEVHATVHEEGTARMRRVDPLHIGAGERLALEPGGLHLMLFGLDAPLKAGETVPLTLTFEVAGQLQVSARVFAADGSQGGEDHSQHGHH